MRKTKWTPCHAGNVFVLRCLTCGHEVCRSKARVRQKLDLTKRGRWARLQYNITLCKNQPGGPAPRPQGTSVPDSLTCGATVSHLFAIECACSCFAPILGCVSKLWHLCRHGTMCAQVGWSGRELCAA